MAMSSLDKKSQLNALQNEDIAMDGEAYDEAIDNASEILLEAMLGDADELIKEGQQLDIKVKMVVFRVARRLLVRLYEVFRAMVIEEAKRQGKTVERKKVVTFKTIFGPIEVSSPYLYDRDAGEGARPMREYFGIRGEAYSAGADRALSDFASESSFREASERFEEHYGWRPGETTTRKRTKAVAEAAESYVEQRLDEELEALDKPPVERALEADQMLVEADGCHIRCGRWMSAEKARQEAETPEQLARLADYEDDEKVRLVEWKEVRTGLVRRMGQVEATYVSKRGDWEEIARQLFRAACGHGLTFETEVVAVGDGAYGLKDGLEEHFPNMQFILDWFHLKHHFFETGQKLAEGGHLVGDVAEWVEGHLDTIYEGEAGAVLGELESLKSTLERPPDREADPEQGEPQTAWGRLDRLIGYLTRFYNCLDYQDYRDNGWPIGSGEVESAHKTVPQRRLKLPGATWAEENISKMCALRVLQANGWWDDFWDDEFDRRQAA